jgi:hypothetical protein
VGPLPATNVGPNAGLHADDVHTPVQAVPQAPQFNRSFVMSVHLPLHSAIPAGHVWTHEPPAHVALPNAGAVQVTPQPPQLLGSWLVSAQVPLHKM